MSKILSEMDLHANLMGMLCPKDNETSAACLRAVLDSHDAMQAQLDAVLAEAVKFAEGYKGKLEKQHGALAYKYGQYVEVCAFLASSLVTEHLKRVATPRTQRSVSFPHPVPKHRSCNRHKDCDEADRRGNASHCSADDCEDCFGQ
jgi:hypothetical protein